jgi:hypothetical protein
MILKNNSHSENKFSKIFKLAFSFFVFFVIFFLSQPVYAETTDKQKPDKVFVGIYLNNVSSINLSENVFMADFYLWFRWKGDIDPTKTLEFTNSYEKWAFNLTPAYETYKNIGGGWKYQVLRVEGKFNYKFDLHSYPMDTQYLGIELEDGSRNSRDLIFVPDEKESGYNKKLIIPGWEIIKQEVTAFEYDYGTSFGQPDLMLNKEKYNRFRFVLSIERPHALFLFKTLLPIVIVLISVFTIFFIKPAYFEVRSGIAITSLLSAVALQITASADLPAVGYMVLIDKIYNLSYLVTLLALVETVICINYKDHGKLEKAARLDRISFQILSLITISAFVIIIFVR